MFLLGSWYGLATTARFVAIVVYRRARSERRVPSLTSSVRAGAADAIQSRHLDGKVAVATVH